MNDRQRYGWAALMWLASSAILATVVERHFGTLAADIASWVPFIPCLYCAWKWRQAGGRLW